MLPKQTEYKVGMYLRLSRDDERVGESLSIENQRTILTKYIEEQHGWTLYDEYVDDGISGTTFERPGVQRLLDDAKNGKKTILSFLSIEDAEKLAADCTSDAKDALSVYEGATLLARLADYLLSRKN